MRKLAEKALPPRSIDQNHHASVGTGERFGCSQVSGFGLKAFASFRSRPGNCDRSERLDRIIDASTQSVFSFVIIPQTGLCSSIDIHETCPALHASTAELPQIL